ncbi:alpha/beta hydrolase-fold protein [Marinobacterium lutimaris]|uniref:Enterochelin esterase n=1 Tax=Marinobacterium lutimaris TaxID=568106 RepID=A0A1H6DLG2_9GAMM|nr:alpha/beta hydrolase-fold protein [Marinobacterium lutimaris]SEG86122.1 enterochelin esterase [Marinobacterium lutimaris]
MPLPLNAPRKLLLSTLATAALSCQLTSAEPALSSADSFTGKLTTTTEIELDLPLGSYIAGTISINSSASNAKADLLIPSGPGKPMRQLLESVEHQGQFRFVTAESPQPLRIHNTTQASDAEVSPQIDYRLSITRQVPPEEQIPPQPEYLSPEVNKLAHAIKSGDSIDTIWQSLAKQGTPLIEPTDQPDSRVMTFLYRGAKSNVRIFGAPPNDHDPMSRLLDSDIWFKSYIVPDDTRLAYQLAPDIPEFAGKPWERRVAITATAQADPLNRYPWPASAATASPYNYDSSIDLRKLNTPPQNEESAPRQGQLSEHQLSSEILGNRRNLWIYRSEHFDPKDPDSQLLILFDGKEYTRKIDVPRIIDNLVEQGTLHSIAAVFIDNPSREARAQELPANPKFADFMADELLPWAEHTLNMDARPEQTILAGSSYGGLAATTVALSHPQLFANVLSMSGSFWWSAPGTPAENSEYVALQVATTPSQPIRFFLSAGVFETARDGVGILETNRHLRDVLTAREYPVEYREYSGGHDYFIWQEILADGLTALAAYP